MTTTNLANALAALADVQGDPTPLRDAIAAYQRAIAVLAGPQWLRQRAVTRHNLIRAEQRLTALGG